ncbi:BnaA06g10460D [Brassica napus]|uniref:(rape) hypothetical protein n=1 Tax=Brassica napus TaxID=3708 RepID=A0A078HIG9_BRANA|nr:unnamed protein product [Brassica napus]CDY36593.1 BnaA06g10460D [Brassica napus]
MNKRMVIPFVARFTLDQTQKPAFKNLKLWRLLALYLCEFTLKEHTSFLGSLAYMANSKLGSVLQSSKYAQIAAKKGPNSLYCLGVPLTTYIQSSWKEATMWFPNSHITIFVSSLITLLLLQLWSFPLLSTPRPPGESSFIFSLTRSTNAAMK